MATVSGAGIERHGVFSSSRDARGSGFVESVTTSFGTPRTIYSKTFTSGVFGVLERLDELSLTESLPTGTQGSSVEEDGRAESLTPASQIIELRDTSGLTIDQIGRLFGVSRRSVHNWINGKPMSPRHEERVGQILTVVRTLPGDTPGERRSQLLSSRSGGSLFQKLRSEAAKDATIQVGAISSRDLLQL